MHFLGYIDPGTGSLFIQSVIGAGLAVIVVFRRVFAKVAGRLRSVLVRQSMHDEE